MPYGIYAPWIQNSMPVNVVDHCRRFIHFSGTPHTNHRVTSGYDPLAKIRLILKKLRSGIKSRWTAGKR